MLAVRRYVPFDSVIDVGCSVGQFLKVCSDLGVKRIQGVDGPWVNVNLLVVPRDRFLRFDISQPGLRSEVSADIFDLTISTEVAEHIEKDKADTYMDNLTAFSNAILFSAAIPGQGGDHHVNEQWPSYWIEKFAARGFVPIDCLRAQLWNDDAVEPWYRQNSLIFVREEKLSDYPLLKKESGLPALDIVHPALWKKIEALEGMYSPQKMGFRLLIKHLALCLVYFFPSFLRALKRRIWSRKE